MSKNIKRLCILTSAAATAALALTPAQQAWAISGNIEIETKQATYDRGDVAEVEIKIKTSDGANFLLQTNMEWTTGLTLQSVTGDNIQYNRGKIIGTAPQPEFVITVKMKVNSNEDQTITLTETKMGAVDGSPNYTIDKKEKIIDVKETVAETAPTTPPITPLPPIEEPTAPPKPEKPYEPWKATVRVTDNLNVREGPGLNYQIIGKLNNGDHVTVTKEQKGGDIIWLKVEKGWISKDYVVEGHLEKPEKTDEEIEKEQQEQINNEAQNTENKNQAANQEAQQKDEDKKQEYEKQEQENITSQTEPTETPEENTIVPDTTNGSQTEGFLNSTNVPEKDTSSSLINPITPIDGSSYAKYQTSSMVLPFYLYLESYSLQFPEEFEKTALTIGELDFLMALPKDISLRQPNVYLAYGNYDLTKEPVLYYFDQTTNSFFPYDKMIEKKVIIDNTVEYTRKPINKSNVLLGLVGIIATYLTGVITTCAHYRKKEKNQPEPPTTKSKVKKPAPDKEVKDMDDEELDYILRYYGASTADMMKKEAQMQQETQRLNSLKNVPPVKRASETTKRTSNPPQTSSSIGWDTLTKIMENPEHIQEEPAAPPPPKTSVNTEDPANITQELDKAFDEQKSANKQAENPDIDTKFESAFHPNDSFNMDELPDMREEFEKTVKEDDLRPDTIDFNKDSKENK